MAAIGPEAAAARLVRERQATTHAGVAEAAAAVLRQVAPVVPPGSQGLPSGLRVPISPTTNRLLLEQERKASPGFPT